MRIIRKIVVAAAIGLLCPLAATPARAADEAKSPAAPAAEAPKIPAAPKASSTRHQIAVDGRPLAYTATAATIDIRNDKDDVIGRMFYAAYTKDGVADPRARPLTFLFNGGPGSSSIWLHMGSVGPMRVVTSEAQATPPAPFGLVENKDTLLDRSDLVFVDAPGTGFSRIVGKGEAKDFYGVDADVKAFAQFIERYVSDNNRWSSPKFLFGESYGTTRSAALVDILQNKGMAFNGVVLVSSILDFGTEAFGVGNDLPYITNIPTYAAVAWYHDHLSPKPPKLDPLLDDARRFAFGPYAAALMKGAKISAGERAETAKKLAQLTGVSEKFWDEADLRVNASRFRKELLRGERRTAGRLDARFTGIDRDAAGENPEYDPADTGVASAFTGAFNSYVRGELKFATDMEYLPTNYDRGPWDWKHERGERRGFAWPGYLDVAEDLREAMTKNPHLRVFVACGDYDLATPFGAAEYTMDHIGLDPSLRNNVSFGYYESGHMLYLHLPSLARFKSDLSSFYEAAGGAK